MNVEFDRVQMLTAWKIACRIDQRASAQPVLQNIAIDVVGDVATLIATNTETSVRIHVGTVSASEPGVILMNTTRFSRILTELTEERLTLEKRKDGYVLRGNSAEFELPGHDASAVATFTSLGLSMPQDTPHVVIKARDLRTAVARTVFAVSAAEGRFSATIGVCVAVFDDHIELVATDNRKLAHATAPAVSRNGTPPAIKGVVSPSVLNLLTQMPEDDEEEISILVGNISAQFQTQRGDVKCQLVEGRFPDWTQITKLTPPLLATMPAGTLAKAIRQASAMLTKETSKIGLTFAENRLVARAAVEETGRSTVNTPVSYTGPRATVFMDGRIMSAMLNAIDPLKVVEFRLEPTGSKPIKLSLAGDDSYTYIAVPLSVKTAAAA